MFHCPTSFNLITDRPIKCAVYSIDIREIYNIKKSQINPRAYSRVRRGIGNGHLIYRFCPTIISHRATRRNRRWRVIVLVEHQWRRAGGSSMATYWPVFISCDRYPVLSARSSVLRGASSHAMSNEGLRPGDFTLTPRTRL